MPIQKESRLLRIGVLGAGPIAQIAHLEACRKGRNTQLYALCEAAPDLLARVAAMHRPQRSFTRYADMLADPQLEAVIVGVADQFHVELARQALDAGKHVLVEKPMGVTVEECEALRDAVVSLRPYAAGRPQPEVRPRRHPCTQFHSGEDRRDDVGPILVLRFGPSLHHDRCPATAGRNQRASTATPGQSQGRPPPLPYVGAREPSDRHGPIPVAGRNRAGACAAAGTLRSALLVRGCGLPPTAAWAIWN